MKKLFLFFAIAMMALMTGCSQISTGNVGIAIAQGKVDAEELTPGWSFTPFKTVYEINAKETHIAFDDLHPKSADNLTMADFDVDVYAKIDPTKAAEIYSKYVGDLVKVKGEDGYRVGFNYLTRAAREAIYEAAAEIKAADMHAKRPELAERTRKLLQDELDAKVGQGWFTVTNVNVRNIVTDQAMESAIKEAAAMGFKVKAKEQEVELARREADRKRAEAQGDADAIRLRAEAITKNGGAEYVQLEAIKKWNGVMPQVAGQSTPFVTIK